jgi:hypothetical protein
MFKTHITKLAILTTHFACVRKYNWSVVLQEQAGHSKLPTDLIGEFLC